MMSSAAQFQGQLCILRAALGSVFNGAKLQFHSTIHLESHRGGCGCDSTGWISCFGEDYVANLISGCTSREPNGTLCYG